MESLDTEADSLISHSLADNTWKCYNTAVHSLNRFRTQYDFPDTWPVPLDVLMIFIAFMSIRGLSPSTVSTYVSGVGFAHKICVLVDNTNCFLITKMIEGMLRIRPVKKDPRVPITLSLLSRLSRSLDSICSSFYETRLFMAAFSLSFSPWYE